MTQARGRLAALTVLLLLLVLAAGPRCGSPDAARSEARGGAIVPRPPQPRATKMPRRLEAHGHVRLDEYHWLNQRDDARVLAYLESENRFTEAATAHLAPLRRTLLAEIRGRIQEDDRSVPYRLGGFEYFAQYEEGKEYAVHCRRAWSSEEPPTVLLDGDALARGHPYFALGSYAVSSAEDILAYAVDTRGRRLYTIRFKDIASGAVLEDAIRDVTANFAWANDNRTLFYARQHPETLRSHRIYRHRLGTPVDSDVLVYEETDETFSTYVFKTKSKRFLMVVSRQTVSDEYRFLPAGDPTAPLTLFEPRRPDLKYQVDHIGDRFLVRTNHEAENFRLVETALGATGIENWRELVPHREDVLLEDFEVFDAHLVLAERREGLTELRVIPWDGSPEHRIAFDDPAYSVRFGANRESATDRVRFSYSSLTTPERIYDYDMDARQRTLLKQEIVRGGYRRQEYRSERLFATAPDGARVPISLVYRPDVARRGGPAPLLLYAYGSYGRSTDARFRSSRLSLLDRGFTFAIAHVRGGQELGRRWYDDGRLLRKRNSFNDFIACAEHLVREGYTSPEQLFAFGGSAGGLLVGVVANLRPELFCGMVAKVPFVDVLTTMLDESIPLTSGEYDEWGDPNRKEFHDYILSYSPYDNVARQAYPHLLVTAGLHDSQVQYWEPAKWVARLRARKTDGNMLLLKTDMSAGHGGPSGRYRQMEEIAFEYAFLLDLAGIRGYPRVTPAAR